MKLIPFWLAIALPVIALIVASQTHYLGAGAFTIMLMIYAFIYHPFVCSTRLLKNNRINKKEFFVLFIPFWRMGLYRKHFPFLFLNKNIYW
jgi:hypothetical protein